jgi:hypothetical protein
MDKREVQANAMSDDRVSDTWRFAIQRRECDSVRINGQARGAS